MLFLADLLKVRCSFIIFDSHILKMPDACVLQMYRQGWKKCRHRPMVGYTSFGTPKRERNIGKARTIQDYVGISHIIIVGQVP